MKKYIILPVCLFFYFGCQQNTSSTTYASNSKFSTNDPARLYFKNIRSIAYYHTRKPNSKIDIYELKKKVYSDKRPILYPMILDNWLDNEAYLFLEKNEFIDFFDLLTIKAEQDTITTLFEIDVFSKDQQYEFATKIYEALKERQTLTVKTKKEIFVPIFENYQDKSNFIITMNDYFRLIEKDRKDRTVGSKQ